MDNIFIWHAYNNDNYIIHSDLYNIQLFNVNNIDINKININHLNKYLNEYVLMYYVWKNNIYSDIVGFSHNRYYFMNIDYDKILNNYIQVYEIFTTPAYNIYEDLNYIGLGYFVTPLIDYIKVNYISYYNDLIELLFNSSNEYKEKIIRNTFICKWDIFDKLMLFITNFLQLVFNKDIHNINIDEIEALTKIYNKLQWDHREQFIKTMKINQTINVFFGYPRNFAFLIEYLTCIFFMLFYKQNYFIYD